MYFFAAWTLLGLIVVPAIAEAKARRMDSEWLLRGKKLKQVDRNAVLLSPVAPLGFTAFAAYRWNFVHPGAPLYRPAAGDGAHGRN